MILSKFYQKARLPKRFKKSITIYDILIFLLAFAFLFFLAFYFKERPTWVKIGVKISSPRWWARETIPPYWLAETIKVGDEEIGFLNQPVAQVEDVQIFETSEDRKDVYLAVKLKANYNKRTNKYTYKGQPVEIGSPIELHLGKTFVQGLITFVSKKEEEPGEFIITGKIINVFPWEAGAVKAGDEMTDGQKRVIAKVEDRKIELADYLTTDWQGNVYLRKDPIKRDAIFKIRIKVSKRGGNFYFRKEQKVKIGEELFLQFENGDLDYLSIMKIEK